MSVQAACVPFLRLEGVGKSFAENCVLVDLGLEIRPGEVLALLGANGAGKSTLVKIIAGSHGHDAGQLLIDGHEVHFTSPHDARRHGIVAVHQQVEQGVVPGLSVAENLLLDELCGAAGSLIFRPREALRRAAEIAAGLQLHLPLQAPIETLGTAERQLVILSRALALKPRLLILDEPTASLSTVEAERLFHLIDHLRERGVAILYISHRLSDLQRVADRALVLRDGRLVGEFSAPLDLGSAVESMLGAALGAVQLQPLERGETVLSLRDWQLEAHSAAFDLDLHEGEVVALTGLLGAGKSEIAEVLFGLRRHHAGSIRLDGRDWLPRTPREAIAAGVFFAAEDRARNSRVPGFSVRASMTLPFLRSFTRFGFVDRTAERAKVAEQIEALGIKGPGPEHPLELLSGGNQQKVILARWLLGQGRVLILDEPFQGVDVRARRDIGQRIRASATGRATLVICSDPDEALEIADRILVVRDGAVVAELPRHDLQRSEIVAHFTPSNPSRQEAARI
ncbi:sugar ABC transporter ATP-binding protein [Pseudomonas sp. PDM22]|uniref:sugar ABC transporter ATP-binding protein n=1 Tax=Pseudomonas sp. PDM22 TaxID=2769287 RepID=UPI0009DADAA4|nr:sugar ABC transporter ATP-binding protein [Pseudomonas sp. PDM22]MBD9518206.1 sugar ABC transporter ATP-binding protein [Pseudomonas sp. PDM22]OQR33064.1 sugar ABC transporter [Pseudomonas sp. T]